MGSRSHEFFHRSPANLSSSLVDSVFTMSKGYPIVLQLINDIALNDCDLDFLYTATYQELPLPELLERLLDKWLYHCHADEPLLAQVLWALCRIPFIGMSPAALATVIDIPSEELSDAMRPLLDTGLVTETRRHLTEFGSILSPHDRLREIKKELDDEERSIDRIQREIFSLHGKPTRKLQRHPSGFAYLH